MISQGSLGNLGVILIHPPKMCPRLGDTNVARKRSSVTGSHVKDTIPVDDYDVNREEHITAKNKVALRATDESGRAQPQA